MMGVNLRSVDLNLLVALDALLTERHVTRAAGRIGLSQPAMSNALTRLRDVFHDELLIRTANGMSPTPYALALEEPLRQALRHIERIFDTDADFVPTRASNRFVARMSDLLGYLLLPRLMADMTTEAPGVSLDIVHLAPARTVDALDRDEIHVAVSMGLEHSRSIRSEMLVTDRMICVMRVGHPLADQALTLEAFLSSGHLKVSMSPTDTRFVDAKLAELRRHRRVAVNVHPLVGGAPCPAVDRSHNGDARPSCRGDSRHVPGGARSPLCIRAVRVASLLASPLRRQPFGGMAPGKDPPGCTVPEVTFTWGTWGGPPATPSA